MKRNMIHSHTIGEKITGLVQLPRAWMVGLTLMACTSIAPLSTQAAVDTATDGGSAPMVANSAPSYRNQISIEYLFDTGNDSKVWDTGNKKIHSFLRNDPNGAYRKPVRLSGYNQRGLWFNGRDKLLNVGNRYALNPNRFTLMAWVKYSWSGYSNPAETRQEIMEKVGAYWMNIRRDTGLLRVGFRTCDGKQRRLDSATPIPENQWIHVAATYADATLKIYIDGELDIVDTFSGEPCASEHPLIIGARYSPLPNPNGRESQVGPDAFFKGSIDSVRVMSRAMDEPVIRELRLQN